MGRIGRSAVGLLVPLVLVVAPAGCSETGTDPHAETSAVASAPAVPDVVEDVEPSVVTVVVGDSQGSGIVYRKDIVLTNAHVVGAAKTVELTLADGAVASGTVVGVDTIADVAVVRSSRPNLPAVAVRTGLPRQGEVALAIGSPLGFQNSVTQGIISGVGRQIPSGQTGGRPLVDLIQTDAPISPGNSGGGLFDAQGQLVGLNEAYIPPQAGAVSLAFAIPSGTVVDVANQILTSGKAVHSYLGVSLTELTDAVRSALGVDAEKGAVIVKVAAGSPAATRGLRAGDVITRMGTMDVDAVEDVYSALRLVRPGDTLAVTVQRGGRAVTTDITLGQMTG